LSDGVKILASKRLYTSPFSALHKPFFSSTDGVAQHDSTFWSHIEEEIYDAQIGKKSMTLRKYLIIAMRMEGGITTKIQFGTNGFPIILIIPRGKYWSTRRNGGVLFASFTERCKMLGEFIPKLQRGLR